MEECIICKTLLHASDDYTKLTCKGAVGINKAASERNVNIAAEAGVVVHKKCRSDFTNKYYISSLRNNNKNTNDNNKRPSRRNDITEEAKKNLCLFCYTPVRLELRNKQNRRDGKADGIRVETYEFEKTIRNICKVRNDKWSQEVLGRIEAEMSDLPAADSVYHRKCSTNFRTNKNIPKEFEKADVSSCSSTGRPENVIRKAAFEKTCDFFEQNDEEQFTLNDLEIKMREYLGKSQSIPYSSVYMKEKLQEFYGDRIVISENKGRPSIVTLLSDANYILREYHSSMHNLNSEEQKNEILKTAAKFIKADIKEQSMGAGNDKYCNIDDLSLHAALDYLPECLKYFFGELFVGKNIDRKIAAIGQSVMQCVRPRAIVAPLQIGLAVQMHFHFRSKYLIHVLHSLGFSSSFNEVQRFERNAAICGDDTVSSAFNEEGTLMTIADNVDHNLCTLNGENTFHGMGMVATISHGRFSINSLSRRNVSNEEILKVSSVDIYTYKITNFSEPNMKFVTLPSLKQSSESSVDILWKLSCYFSHPIPSWSGVMETIYNNQDLEHTGKSSIAFLPIIDLNPSDMTCIYSTLKFLSNFARKHNKHSVITFDQPLYWKSEMIVSTTHDMFLKNIVLILGPFHTQMNFLGCIGTIMAGSGISDILEEVYGENAVKHILIGKAYARAVRGHLLLDLALTTLIIKEIKCKKEDMEIERELHDVSVTYEKLLSREIKMTDVQIPNKAIDLNNLIAEFKITMSEKSKTGKLWAGYQNMVENLRKMLHADRESNFHLQLEALADALPIFAAAGHYNYVKSGYLYLQQMLNLSSSHPEVYDAFVKKGYAVRRSDRYWAGLAPDLVIEQVLMRSLKSTGGLTRGTGFTDIQRSIWLKSMPICSLYNCVMQELTGVTFMSSEQHKGTSKSRISRDCKDLQKILIRLTSISPITVEFELKNIASGFIADDSINVHNFTDVGHNLIKQMEGCNTFTFSSKRKDKVRTFADANSVKLPNSDVSIDPCLLFQRLLVVANTSSFDVNELSKYELSAYPTSIFENTSMLREADKPPLAKAIRSVIADENIHPFMHSNIHQFVLDGGSLIYRVPWKKNSTYSEIADSYANFVMQKYQNAIVIFDSYSDLPSTKDITHNRRTGGKMYAEIQFTPEMTLGSTKEKFLSNLKNKQQIINLIAEKLSNKGCNIIHSDGDADLDIATTALKMSEICDTTLIGEDTDLLVLLLYLYSKEKHGIRIQFRSDKEKSKRNIYDISLIYNSLGADICSMLPPFHAFTGCDTTSAIFSIGKPKMFQKLLHNSQVKMLLNTFNDAGRSHDEIEKAGSALMIKCYSDHHDTTLNELRQKMLIDKIVNAKFFVKPERLPPSESATKFHSYRVYHQVQTWRGNKLTSTDWGWMEANGILLPKTTMLPPAPPSLMKIIRCNCTQDCSSRRCSCRKNGLSCTSACGKCQITICCNQEIIIDENAFEDLVDDNGITDEVLDTHPLLGDVLNDILDI